MNKYETGQRIDLSIRDLLLSDPQLKALSEAFDYQESIIENTVSDQGFDIGFDNEIDNDTPTLIESIEAIKDVDLNLRSEIFDSLASFVKNGTIKAEDIPKLVHSFDFDSNASQESLEKYGIQRGAMTWRDFKIVLHSSLLEKDDDGKFRYKINQHLGHELGHSIHEAGAISIEELRNFFSNININFESKHISNLVNNQADEELILKERFAEVVGLYLACKSEDNPEAYFIKRRAECSPESVVSAEEMAGDSQKLYNKIESIWPEISNTISSMSLEELMQRKEAEEYTQELVLAEPRKTEPAAPVGGTAEISQALGGTGNSVSSQPTAKSGSKGYSESPDIARSQPHKEGFLETVKNFLGAFASEVPNVQ